jgi:hypothetical protein
MGQEAPRRRQGRIAPRPTLFDHRLHRHQPEPPGQTGSRLLQLNRTGIAGGRQAIVADESEGEADQDRCQDRHARPVHHVPVG